MNIMYLIGNGFDLNLKMKTGYPDFYKYYLGLPLDNNSDTIKSFRSKLEEDAAWNFSNWSDLKRKLGMYLEFLNVEEAIGLHRHLINHLSQYIKLEEDKYPFIKNQQSRFIEYKLMSWDPSWLAILPK